MYLCKRDVFVCLGLCRRICSCLSEFLSLYLRMCTCVSYSLYVRKSHDSHVCVFDLVPVNVKPCACRAYTLSGAVYTSANVALCLWLKLTLCFSSVFNLVPSHACFFCLSASVCFCVCPPVCLSICPFISTFICPSVCVYTSVCHLIFKRNRLQRHEEDDEENEEAMPELVDGLHKFVRL